MASAGTPFITDAFSERFAEQELIHFQVTMLGGASYVWIGTEDGRQDALAMGVPSAFKTGPPATGTTLLGGGSSDGVSQTMAQRLSCKLGQPVFVSMNLPDDKDGALRLFAEAKLRDALQRLLAGAVESGVSAQLSSLSTSPPASSAAAGASPPLPTAPPPPAKPAMPAADEGSRTAALNVGARPSSSAADGVGVGTRTYEVFDATGTLGDRAVELLLEAASAAIDARGVFCVALSGGSIPALVGGRLAAAAARARFERWEVFLADERHVPSDHAENSLRAWRAELLDAVGVRASSVHSLDASAPLERAAAAYEAALTAVAGEPPRLDAVLLGMGPDGHTASLFPGHALLHESARWVAPIGDSPKPPPARATLTLPALNGARLALFVVTGGSKADAVRRAFAPEPDVPAGLVLATASTVWLLDAPAAEELLAERAKHQHLYS